MPTSGPSYFGTFSFHPHGLASEETTVIFPGIRRRSAGYSSNTNRGQSLYLLSLIFISTSEPQTLYPTGHFLIQPDQAKIFKRLSDQHHFGSGPRNYDYRPTRHLHVYTSTITSAPRCNTLNCTMFVEANQIQGFTPSNGHASGDGNVKGFTPRSRQNSGHFSGEDHTIMMRNMHLGSRRPPQRSRTTHEHIPAGPQLVTVRMGESYAANQQSRASMSPSNATATAPHGEQAQKVTAAAPEAQETADSVSALEQDAGKTPHSRRPKLGPPRRSYSVMDYEPVPPEQQPPAGPLTLSTLPPEIHFAIFDQLDPIDATCLGLVNRHFYSIHRRIHGSVPLSVRRDGPNELEWAWHKAAYPSHTATVSTTNTLGHSNSDLTTLRVRGKGLCRKCGVSRCELQKHIRDWIPDSYEYCSVREKFVPKPGEDAKTHCYMSNPTNSTRCGRHRLKKVKKPEQS